MVKITFPDGAKRDYDAGVTAMDVAKSLSKSLAKKILAAKINGEVWDASREIDTDASIELITAKDPEGLELIRHGRRARVGRSSSSTIPRHSSYDRPRY